MAPKQKLFDGVQDAKQKDPKVGRLKNKREKSKKSDPKQTRKGFGDWGWQSPVITLGSEKEDKQKYKDKNSKKTITNQSKKGFRHWGWKSPVLALGREDKEDEGKDDGSSSLPDVYSKDLQDEDTFARAKKEPKRKGVGKKSKAKTEEDISEKNGKEEDVDPSEKREEEEMVEDKSSDDKDKEKDEMKDPSSRGRPPFPREGVTAIDRSWQRRRSVWQIESPDPSAGKEAVTKFQDNNEPAKRKRDDDDDDTTMPLNESTNDKKISKDRPRTETDHRRTRISLDSLPEEKEEKDDISTPEDVNGVGEDVGGVGKRTRKRTRRLVNHSTIHTVNLVTGNRTKRSSINLENRPSIVTTVAIMYNKICNPTSISIDHLLLLPSRLNYNCLNPGYFQRREM